MYYCYTCLNMFLNFAFIDYMYVRLIVYLCLSVYVDRFIISQFLLLFVSFRIIISIVNVLLFFLCTFIHVMFILWFHYFTCLSCYYLISIAIFLIVLVDVHVHLYMCMYTRTCIHIYTYTHVCTCMYMNVYM